MVRWFMALMLAGVATPAQSAVRILFVGNSLTYGAASPSVYKLTPRVPVLHGGTIGGVAALVSLLAEQNGLDYDIKAEVAGGKSVAWQMENEKRLIAGENWDIAILQDHVVYFLNWQKGGIATAQIPNLEGTTFDTRGTNRKVFIASDWILNSALKGAPDLDRQLARFDSEAVRAYGVPAQMIPVGQAMACAHQSAIAPGTDGSLWPADGAHGSAQGYYLAALITFAKISGRAPNSADNGYKIAERIGIASADASRLQQLAARAIKGVC